MKLITYDIYYRDQLLKADAQCTSPGKATAMRDMFGNGGWEDATHWRSHTDGTRVVIKSVKACQ